jgi:predicted ATPase/class 3 adenylate cyclase
MADALDCSTQMQELPTGIVTFLFTDIEGSTRLLQELGPRYAAIQARHGAILRHAIAELGGVEVNTEGDSFFVAFAAPAAAVAAAVQVQRDLSAEKWPLDGGVRVRMGIHTGEGVLGGRDYLGIDVNRAARIAAAAHGGQILISEATRALVEQSTPDGASLRDLGPHRLRDIAHPVHLYDVVIEGLPCDFPPPRTLDARPNNLPVQLTSFVGREEEIAAVRALLGRARLVTLTGTGGTGKTRLALAVATEMLPEYSAGVFFVDLSSLVDPALVPSAVAAALSVPEVAGRPILDTLADSLRPKQLLLVLDNFEQVVEACPVIETLLTSAPKVKVLVTSRVTLALRGEHEYEVPPLEPPLREDVANVAKLMRVDAVRLFAERAMAASPGFEVTKENAEAIAAITARLDGLPLAIELAATRTKVLTPKQIRARLHERLSILTSGPRTLPERQRTLRGAIAWSFDLLEPAEQKLFSSLSVFNGGFTIESAEAVCVGVDVFEGVSSLVDQSLLRRSEPGEAEVRFFMLETIREFGLERLRESGDLDERRRQHADHFLALAAAAEGHLVAEDQVEWLDRLDVEHPNVRAALRWAIDAGDVARAQEAAGAIWRFWQQRGHLAEGRGWLEEVLTMPEGRAPSAARAKALIGLGGVAWWQKERETAGEAYEEALAIERQLGDPARTAEALYNLAFVAAGDDIESAAHLLEEALELFRRAGHQAGVAQVLGMLVIREAEAGNWPAVATSLEETTAIWRRLGDRLHLAFDLVWLAFSYGRMGDAARARSAGLDALRLFCEVDNPTGIGITLVDLAFLATWEGRHEDAIRLAGASESLRQRVGGPPGGFAGLLEGDPAAEARVHLSEERAARAWEEGLTMSLDDAVALARREPVL